ncbi:MAG: MFS transporter [Calditrichia bacterium]
MTPKIENQSLKKSAYRFIILMGIVSLFGDVTYEGARSIIGPFLAQLGATAAVVGIIAGGGEFLGYVLRLLSGYLSDRTQKYWTLTIMGYGALISIPILAFAGHWSAAALLIILERIGKGIRSPARDTILSYATSQTGRGMGFGLHEALDQVGAIIGPFIFTLIFYMHGDYREGFSLLWIPALLCVLILLLAKKQFPHPQDLEKSYEGQTSVTGTSFLKQRPVLLYLGFTFFSVLGLINFPILAYHFKLQAEIPEGQIALLYAIAMGVDALVALLIGKTYDLLGFRALIVVPLLTLPIPFIAFTNGFLLIVLTACLWGGVLGIHETIMRAAIADITPGRSRGIVYGVFNTLYGLSWFMGGALAGVLYDIHIDYLQGFVVLAVIVSIVFLILFMKNYQQKTERN